MSPDPAPILRVTTRCLEEDLGLGPLDAAAVSVLELAEQDPIINAFVSMRSQSPVGQEVITDLTSRITAWTLHHGRHRGATWHDEHAGAVWLLAVRFHRSGEHADAYPYFRELDSAGRLLPTEHDYLALEKAQARTFAEAILDTVPDLLDEARRHPGEIRGGIVAGRIRVRLLFEVLDEDLPTMAAAISQRLLPGNMDMPTDWLMALVAALLPGTPFEQLESLIMLGDWPLATDEIAYRAITDD